MAELFIPTPLRKFTNGKAQFDHPAATVDELLKIFVTEHEQVRPHLYEAEGGLRSFIRIYVGDEDLEALNGLETVLEEHTEVSIIPAIAGGTQTLAS